MKKTLQVALAILALLAAARPADAQWMSQTNILKPGWNGVFLHVDASYAGNSANTFATVLGAAPVTAISMWNPPTTAQYIGSPSSPLAGTGWNSWVKNTSAENNTLTSLPGDTAYLFYNSSAANYTMVITGKVVTPRNHWDVSGLNFLGFSTVPGTIKTPPVPPLPVLNFQNYLSTSTDLTNSSLTELYSYSGGEISTTNPMLVTSYQFPITSVVRGTAYWIRQGTTFSHYFGPFEVILSSGGGADFGTNLNTYTITLRNHTVNNLTVTMNLVPSLAPPAGRDPIVAVPPLILRGALDISTLQYAFTTLTTDTPSTFTLAKAGKPGSDVQVVLGLNRSAVTNADAGSLIAGILRFTDSLGFTEVDVPTTAIQGSDAGLWVGTVGVTNVSEFINSFNIGSDGNPAVDPNSATGAYQVTGVNTDPAPTATAFKQRLIVFNPPSDKATLLQRVYYGLDANTNPVVATKESSLNTSLLAQARRISSIDFPWSASNAGWSFSGNLQSGNPLTVTVTDQFNDQISNPFIHSYHPDHDNRDHSVANGSPPTYSEYATPGAESYTIMRTITLIPAASAVTFASLTAGNNAISGKYNETLNLIGNGSFTRTILTSGYFVLNHISPIATLTQAP